MPKRESGTSVDSDKKKRNVITLDKKLDITSIERCDNGESKASMSRTLGLSESAVRLILSKSNEYTEQGGVASTSPRIQCTRNRIPIAVEMEYLLLTWLEDCNQKPIPIGTNNVIVKSLSLLSSLEENRFKGDTMIFSASRGRVEVRVPSYRFRGSEFEPRRYQIFWEVVGLERGSLNLVRKIEELLE
jgi:hypothetical protein